jgi:hypothetical protein
MEQWYPHSTPLIGKKCYEAYHGRSKPCDVCPSRRTIETGKAAFETIPKRETPKKLLDGSISILFLSLTQQQEK